MTITATLMFPHSLEAGQRMEDIAIFAARRCRTIKTHDELWDEVNGYSLEKKAKYLNAVVHEDWALDVLEMLPIHFDIESAPVWLTVELLRHRLVWRDFSMEQMSQRAIKADRLQFTVPTPLEELTQKYILDIAKKIEEHPEMKPEDYRAAFPTGTNVNMVIAGNMRAFMHFFFMRSSTDVGGAGGAHPMFVEMADSMLEQTRKVYKASIQQIIKA